MLPSGNSKVPACANNLLQLTRGEVPLDQLRGLRADLIDMPATAAAAYLQAAAHWVIEHYEPRLSFDSLSLAGGSSEGFFVSAAATAATTTATKP